MLLKTVRQKRRLDTKSFGKSCVFRRRSFNLKVLHLSTYFVAFATNYSRCNVRKHTLITSRWWRHFTNYLTSQSTAPPTTTPASSVSAAVDRDESFRCSRHRERSPSADRSRHRSLSSDRGRDYRTSDSYDRGNRRPPPRQTPQRRQKQLNVQQQNDRRPRQQTPHGGPKTFVFVAVIGLMVTHHVVLHRIRSAMPVEEKITAKMCQSAAHRQK
jgi:hypothetical protein